MTTSRMDWALLISVALHAALLVSFATTGGLGAGGIPEPQPLRVLLPAQGAATTKSDPADASSADATRSSPVKLGHGEPGGLPTPLAQIDPEYPEAAYALGISGRVEVAAVVDERGRVEHAYVVSTTLDDVFNRSALKTVREARFAPGMVDGRPTRGLYRAVIEYQLK